MTLTATLAARYDVHAVTIRGNSQISTRAAALITQLAEPAAGKSVFSLQASAKASNKLISIVEIVKRELRAECKDFFQYTALSSESISVDVKVPVMPGDADGDQDDTFAYYERNVPPITQTKTSPVLTVYLSSAPIKELKALYGEQKG